MYKNKYSINLLDPAPYSIPNIHFRDLDSVPVLSYNQMTGTVRTSNNNVLKNCISMICSSDNPVYCTNVEIYIKKKIPHFLLLHRTVLYM